MALRTPHRPVGEDPWRARAAWFGFGGDICCGVGPGIAVVGVRHA